MWKGITILFTIIVFAGFNAFAKSEPLRYFLLYSIPGPHPERYQFSDWEEIKSHLSTSILHDWIIKGDELVFYRDSEHTEYYADSFLERLGKMELKEDERKIIRAYLLSFLDEYLHDIRFERLLNPIWKKRYNNNDIDAKLYHRYCKRIPSYILCVIAFLNPEVEDVDKAGEMLFQFNLKNPNGDIGYYFIHFIKDLQYFRNFDKIKPFLEKHDVSLFSRNTSGFIEEAFAKEKRDLRIGQLLKALTAPVNLDLKHIKFDSNPKQEVRKQLLQEGIHVALYIDENKGEFMKPNLPLEILYLLGEIHTPISFSLLLENYALALDFRSAITLACCTDFDYNVRTLFSTLTSKKLLDKYLKDVLTNIPGGYWEKIEKLPPDQQQLFYQENLKEIRQKAIERAKPILG